MSAAPGPPTTPTWDANSTKERKGKLNDIQPNTLATDGPLPNPNPNQRAHTPFDPRHRLTSVSLSRPKLFKNTNCAEPSSCSNLATQSRG